MNNKDEDKIINIAYYILENKTTIRAAAKYFNIPKSTIHYKLNNNLKYINFNLYQKIKILLNENFKIKHLHGGEATRKKYLKKDLMLN